MSLYFTSLNSGSNGNCYYIGNSLEAVMIDAGISCRETERRMIRLGLSIRKVKGIFISHEHIDHIRGAEVLSRKYGIPVYITEKTYDNSRLKLDPLLINGFNANETVHIGSLCVKPVRKQHDAAEPHSFTVCGNGITVGVFTDIGTASENVVHHFNQCHAAFLEANFDDEMLEKGRYPRFLKRRIRSDEGHLSNDQALDLFINHRPQFMNLLVLSHLSEHNNHPQLVHDLFSTYSNGTRIVVASRYEESEVFCFRQDSK